MCVCADLMVYTRHKSIACGLQDVKGAAFHKMTKVLDCQVHAKELSVKGAVAGFPGR